MIISSRQAKFGASTVPKIDYYDDKIVLSEKWTCIKDALVKSLKEKFSYGDKIADDCVSQTLHFLIELGAIREPERKITSIHNVNKFRQDIYEEKYNGYVHCVNVKNNIIYVRRNGKPMWCGNCMLYWAKCGQIKVIVPLDKFNQVNSPETITRAFRSIIEEHHKKEMHPWLKYDSVDRFREDRQKEVRKYFGESK